MALIRHVGWPLAVTRLLELPPFVAAAQRAEIELRPWHGRQDYDAVALVSGEPLSDRAMLQAAWLQRPLVILSREVVQGFGDASALERFLHALGDALREDGPRESGPSARSALPLVRQITDWIMLGHKKPLHLASPSGCSVLLSPNLWWSSRQTALQLAACADEDWSESRLSSKPDDAGASGVWSSVESLLVTVALRRRLVPFEAHPASGFLPRLADVPDLLTVVGQPDLLRAAVIWRMPRSIIDLGRQVPGISTDGLKALWIGCAWAGLAHRSRRYLADGRLVGESHSGDGVVGASGQVHFASRLPPALAALARRLRLIPAHPLAHGDAARSAPRDAAVEEEKIVIAGDYAAGKTTALKTLLEADALTMDVENQDPRERSIKSTTTVGFDYGTLVLGTERLHVYAVPGQERFRVIASSLIEGVHGALVLVDGSQPSVEATVRSWISLIRENAPEASIVIALNRVTGSTPSLPTLRATAHSASPGPIAVTVADPRRAIDMLGCLRLIVLLRHPEVTL